jgi:hypothetical protein
MRIMVLALAITVVGWLTAHAESEIRQAVDPAYPGFASETGILTYYAMELVQNASNVFYMLHGRWPVSFAEIRKEGLIQTDLLGFRLDVINPDDGTLDYAGDVVFLYNKQDDSVSVRFLDMRGRPRMFTLTERPRTIDALLSLPDPVDLPVEQQGALARQKGNLPLHKAYCLISMIKGGFATFISVHGRQPYSWDELSSSKLAGLDKNSINPLTGKKIDGLGGPNGILIQRKGNAFYIEVRGPDGNRLPGFISF